MAKNSKIFSNEKKKNKAQSLIADTLLPNIDRHSYTDEQRASYRRSVEEGLYNKRATAQKWLYSYYQGERAKFLATRGVIDFLDSVMVKDGCTGLFSFAFQLTNFWAKQDKDLISDFSHFLRRSKLLEGRKMFSGVTRYIYAWFYLKSTDWMWHRQNCSRIEDMPIWRGWAVTPGIIEGYKGFDFNDYLDLLEGVGEINGMPSLPAVCRCGSPLPDEDGYDKNANISFDVDKQKSYYDRMNCHSTWTCPVCAQNDGFSRAMEIAEAIEAAVGKGLKVLFLTFTIPHHETQDCGTVLSNLKDGYRYFSSMRSVKNVQDRYGYIGNIKSTDFTINPVGNKPNWHAHYHCLYFYDTKMPIKELANRLKTEFTPLWDHAQKRETGEDTSDEHGLDVKAIDLSARGDSEKNAKTIAEYAAKTVSLYVAKSYKDKGHLTPFDLLVPYYCDEYKHVTENYFRYRSWFIDYYKGSKGVRRMVWSRGLKGLLLSDKDKKRRTVNIGSMNAAAVRTLRRSDKRFDVLHKLDKDMNIDYARFILDHEWNYFARKHTIDYEGNDGDGFLLDTVPAAIMMTTNQELKMRACHYLLNQELTPDDVYDYAEGIDFIDYLDATYHAFDDAARCEIDLKTVLGVRLDYIKLVNKTKKRLGLPDDCKGKDFEAAVFDAEGMQGIYFAELGEIQDKWGVCIVDGDFDVLAPDNLRPGVSAAREIQSIVADARESLVAAGIQREYVFVPECGLTEYVDAERLGDLQGCRMMPWRISHFTGAFSLSDFYSDTYFYGLFCDDPQDGYFDAEPPYLRALHKGGNLDAYWDIREALGKCFGPEDCIDDDDYDDDEFDECDVPRFDGRYVDANSVRHFSGMSVAPVAC